jgi:mannose-6-phosphate isomerase-like protein (cupin superfamily)
METQWMSSQLQERFIPFSSLRYSTDAFIDYRIPGCGPKKNYALIGPGVSQNPNQPVSLREKHGFQVGGVAMPAGVTNPPHMHFTAEVFLCASGHWNLHWGFNPQRQEASLGPGDIVSIPTWIYRGFESRSGPGLEEGFMFTALGRDDTGGILWGPQTLEAAREQGVHLTEDYQIIDEHLGDKWEAHMKRLQPMTPEEIGQLRTWSPAQMSQRIVRFADLDWSARALLDSALPGCGAQMAPAIGLGMSAERNHLAPVMNAHGFSIEWLKIPAQGQVSMHALTDKQVVICKQGQVQISMQNSQEVSMEYAQAATKIIANGRNQTSSPGWDTYAMPADVWRSYQNLGDEEALLIMITAGDHKKRIHWADSVQQLAAAAGWAVDANGFVALKRFTDRSQR